MADILIIDDDPIMSDTLCDIVARTGHCAVAAGTIRDGFQKAMFGRFAVVFLDVRLPDGNGLEALQKIKNFPSSPEVIIITGYGGPEAAEISMQNGAWDYIEKTSSINEMMLCLVRAIQYHQEKNDGKRGLVFKRGRIIGSSARMETCLELAAHAALGGASVLITGETGTGKELFADAIHRNSARYAGRLVTVDCAALPQTLVESVLFGYEKGAFTGADRSHAGLISQADDGILFLDEVGELPLSIQKIFLRVLQERCFRPVGGKQESKSDFRLIAATNRNLYHMVESGAFREDLLFRLSAVTIEIPPLREHREDIMELVLHYIAAFCESQGLDTKGFSPELLEALTAYDWPGNVRELLHTIERAITVARFEPTLYPIHLPTNIRIKLSRISSKSPMHMGQEFSTMKRHRETMDIRYLQSLMNCAGHDIKEVCKISGLSRGHLYALLSKYKISRNDLNS